MRVILVAGLLVIGAFAARADALPDAWRPYPTAEAAVTAPAGFEPANRFPNLKLTRADGSTVTLGQLRGKIVFLHFWAKWCPPCVREIPVIGEFVQKLDRKDVEIVFVPLREKIEISRPWLAERIPDAPLYSAGAETGWEVELGDGGKRRMSFTNPRTFVLDRNGLVLRNIASNLWWGGYGGVFDDAIKNSAPFLGTAKVSSALR